MASRGLGRGLGALIPEGTPSDARIPQTDVPIDRIVPNPYQPRTYMNEGALLELAESIKIHGIIQPILVTQERGDDGQPIYQIIAGERRFRAARTAGLTRVPVTIRQSTPQELLEIAIIENVQRADLSPLEEASAYLRLLDEFHLTQAEVSVRVGKSRTAIGNIVRLATLSPEIQAALASGEITEGHARALLGVTNIPIRQQLFLRASDDHVNVRQTARIVREALTKQPPSPEPIDGGRMPPAPTFSEWERQSLELNIQRALGTKVAVKRNAKGAGSLTIHFYSDEELEGVLERLGVREV